MSAARQYCSFMLNGMLFGLEVTKVQEVIRSLEMTPVPLAPDTVRGLINLRGQIVTAIDVKRRLSLPQREGSAEPCMSVVIRTDSGPVSLLVDDIHGVLEVEAVDFEDPPDNLPLQIREMIGGAYKLRDRLLMVLDVERLVEFGGHADDLN